ncbi:MAG: SAM-dependent methyltransferase [Dorea sp.]|nr:SAM-dependent methyltransferase [Dorea sp.]
MENLRRLLQENLNIDFVSAILSGPRGKDGILKVKVRPLLKKDTLLFQLEIFRGNQAFHKNLAAEEAAEEMFLIMKEMKQLQVETKKQTCTALVSRKGKVTIKSKQRKTPAKMVNLEHNRKKRYILEEGEKAPFLVDLGVMTEDGKVVRQRFDKFRQINRFLEFVEDILPELPKGRELTVLDFGCGKSYLTFAMYYYLHELKRYDIRIIGLDLKEEVIRRCNELSERYGYEKLHFLKGDIAEYKGVEAVDMVVTLHACDTATDYALAKAVKWNAKVILSVPCCQHEVNRQIAGDALAPVLEYGLIKERMAALITDALRAQYLEREGYRTQILEFIDMEHTPKNILIRAVKTGTRKKNFEAVRACEEALHIAPLLGRLLEERSLDREQELIR